MCGLQGLESTYNQRFICIDDILDTLSGSKYFTVLYMKSGYHPIEIEETHKERTAFAVGPLGFYEYQRVPCGLANSPATVLINVGCNIA